ncbi:MAG: 4a-hydroxytetrahydrobiopterin dehydratase [Chloroflexi bacterium]|nr:4a-hydroxytetrahydrobiopterin dehydratase [Chloroflexota bacterium]
MRQLAQEKCVACRAGAPPATDQEMAELRAQAPEWKAIVEGDIRKVQRTFRFRDFARALAFTNAVGNLAEAEGHHPRLVTEWGSVTVTWWTHNIRDLHRNDLIMAAKTDALYTAPAEGKG